MSGLSFFLSLNEILPLIEKGENEEEPCVLSQEMSQMTKLNGLIGNNASAG